MLIGQKGLVSFSPKETKKGLPFWGVARIFQMGGHTGSNNIVMEFSPRNIVGCLLKKKGLQRGGHGHLMTPLATPLPLPPNGKAFLISFWQNFSMRRRSKKNICQRSIIVAWRLWWSFLCSRVLFFMIPFRFELLKTVF